MTDGKMLLSADPAWFDALEAQYRRDPASVPADWRALFEGRPVPVATNGAAVPTASTVPNMLDGRVARLIDAYRARGYLVADYDPLGLADKPDLADLDPAFHGLSEADLEMAFAGVTKGVTSGDATTLRSLIDHLKASYCGSLSADFAHLEDSTQRQWIATRMEDLGARQPAADQRRWILEQLTVAEGFENFLQVKYPTSKRFGMEGSEAQLPMSERLLERAVGAGIEEIVIGPMHRGRTTFMATFMGKPLAAVIGEFAGKPPYPEDYDAAGDVSYHIGHSGNREVDGKTIRLSMASHPSHIEAVIPVSLGKLRAKQAMAEDPSRILGIMMHTDGGFAGQGLVSETLQLARLDGFQTRGSIHVTVDNRVAFTTRPEDQRSSRFASDIVKLIGAPVFRVNADDPEAAVRAADLAFDFWETFGVDVAIELICYRRRGHNEMDEPRYTQPGMYQKVDALPPVRSQYQDRLVADGVIDAEGAQALLTPHLARFEEGFEAAQTWRPNAPDWRAGRWAAINTRSSAANPDPETGVAPERLRELGKKLHMLPDGFSVHPKIARQLDERQESVSQGAGIAWSTAEALAFATLLDDGHGVRLTGQDSRRGTFSHRHGVLFDQITDQAHAPLGGINPGARFELYDSPLAEASVLGFEYGYSTADPQTLVCWEAQFGDFANGAQIIIDQYIAAAEEKWFRLSGLVMLLPHGLEGGGPDHSSARVERFLQLCARDNLQVVNCTTPANYFHVLRRQMLRDFRTPLVLMTPKSLLRHRRAVSDLADLGTGSSFAPVLGDGSVDRAQRHVFCCGRIYYDLVEARDAAGRDDIAVTRVEELYPLPEAALRQELARHPDAELIWCQEEPMNMGPWTYMERCLREIQGAPLRYVGPAANPSSASGYPARHKAAQAKTIAAALA